VFQSFQLLDNLNALENVTLPQINRVIDYINKELDELEREDFTRLKMVKKKKEAAIKAAEMAAAEAAAADEDLSAAPKFSGTPSKGFVAEGGEEEVKTEKKKGKKKKAAAESALSAFAEEDDDVVFR
jgi:V-type H+-transporting ATPase subunit D